MAGRPLGPEERELGLGNIPHSFETSRGKDDLDEVGERKKVDGLHRLLPPLRGGRGRSGLPPGPSPCSQHSTTTPRSSSPPSHERGVEDSGGHGNGGLGTGGCSQVRGLLKNGGTTRLPHPSNPAEMLELRERVDELTTENESLKKELSQLNREVSSLKQQLQKANEEKKKYREMYEDFQKLSDQKQVFIDQLVKKAASLR
ncbi:bZIP transcription factor family protein [Giardia muris]|uniref:BZIP transcription factor family protein n=1 Tax=Giardia muris TaxID=5742 RepID=A0A4Z1STD3_GIAMU|nr:bZIP transcription factor family protein [Giardia muris]|eukprot:TNJ28255.1 bZIP transcription factor family protein [Giardia muris]